MNIVEFLRARLDEDEAAARKASPGGWTFGTVESVAGGMLYDETRTIGDVYYEQPRDHDGSIVRHLLSDEANANGTHIARHDPARVLREVKAKREILKHYDPPAAPFIRAMAAVYSDHPDYRDEWE